jgi:hypothetical protein
MSERVSRSIHQTIFNVLTILAQQGDSKAIAALQHIDEVAEEFEFVDDDAEGEMLIEQDSGTYLVTRHGATFLPRSGVSR